MHIRSTLTRKFLPYVLAKKEKEMGKSFLQFLDVGQLEIGKILFLIQVGNSTSPAKEKFMSEEEAGQILQQYLDQRDAEGNFMHSVISAFIDIIGDMDIDLGFLREIGMSTEQMYDNIKRKTSGNIAKAVDTASTPTDSAVVDISTLSDNPE